KIIQSIASIAFISVFLLSVLDHRFAWSIVSPLVSVMGDLLVALGLLAVFFVFKENTYTSGVIELAAEQTVIATGPYSLVRHPMYMGALVMVFGIPLALGSWRGLLTMIPFTLVIIGRLLDEERFLIGNLRGYAEYRQKVKHRLVPYIW
ncbi:MAG: isoprenylcysteine carboxylmethyltransferase family protein, partial [Chloroflexi bacterium]|nr:isoprenylcysteine carboxylmethyltransferase family protein [Chloroflexota bacterium]